ncbi:hypothetical protein A3Q56_04150 [Intoshia linei]|uniref:Uncharacterized protein n=1 Tax=Intoshia linei TaxID=1819745 RepID=A0A177B3U1_9BILA|nr:hypothetical protein A3Q56_04150 [Intoshia linei]
MNGLDEMILQTELGEMPRFKSDVNLRTLDVLLDAFLTTNLFVVSVIDGGLPVFSSLAYFKEVDI